MHAARGGMEGKFRKGCQKLAEEGGLARQLSKQFSLATVPDPAAKAKARVFDASRSTIYVSRLGFRRERMFLCQRWRKAEINFGVSPS